MSPTAGSGLSWWAAMAPWKRHGCFPVLGAIVDHGSETVAEALEAALEAGRCDLLAMAGKFRQANTMVEVPAALQSYEIEAGSPADYDVLLRGGVR